MLDLLVLRVPSFGHIEFHAHWDAERRDRPFLANDAAQAGRGAFRVWRAREPSRKVARGSELCAPEKALGNLHVVRFHAAGDL